MGKRVLKVFAPATFEGVTGIAVIQEVINEDIVLDVQYIPYIDFRDYKNFIGHAYDTEEVDPIVLVLGAPYKGYTLPDEFYIAYDNSFTDFLHFSSHGEEIRGNNGEIVSIVDTENAPIVSLMSILQQSGSPTILSKHVTITKKALQLVDAINAYHTWTWQADDNQFTKVLLALYNGCYKYLPNVIAGLTPKEIVRENAAIIKGQLEKMNDFIKRKAEVAKVYQTTINNTPCTFVVVYADEYINELAHTLLNKLGNDKPVAVCIGRATKNSDMLSIRTKGISANEVAHFINEGSGKYEVASVFLGTSMTQIVGNGIVTQLEGNV